MESTGLKNSDNSSTHQPREIIEAIPLNNSKSSNMSPKKTTQQHLHLQQVLFRRRWLFLGFGCFLLVFVVLLRTNESAGLVLVD